VRASAQILKSFTPTAQVETAELFIGLLVCSPVSGDKLAQSGGIDELVRIILENPSNIKVHFSWAKRAMANMISLANMNIGSKQESFVQLIKALQVIAQLGVIKVGIDEARQQQILPQGGETLLKQEIEVSLHFLVY
jgi:hypothetical protein